MDGNPRNGGKKMSEDKDREDKYYWETPEERQEKLIAGIALVGMIALTLMMSIGTMVMMFDAVMARYDITFFGVAGEIWEGVKMLLRGD